MTLVDSTYTTNYLMAQVSPSKDQLSYLNLIATVAGTTNMAITTTQMEIPKILLQIQTNKIHTTEVTHPIPTIQKKTNSRDSSVAPKTSRVMRTNQQMKFTMLKQLPIQAILINILQIHLIASISKICHIPVKDNKLSNTIKIKSKVFSMLSFWKMKKNNSMVMDISYLKITKRDKIWLNQKVKNIKEDKYTSMYPMSKNSSKIPFKINNSTLISSIKTIKNISVKDPNLNKNKNLIHLPSKIKNIRLNQKLNKKSKIPKVLQPINS